MSSVEPVLELRGVVKDIDEGVGTRRVLDAVDLVVRAGEVVSLVGPSGSGKTTLLTIATGFGPPDAGTVRPGATGRAWNHTAVLPQSLALLPELTVAENVALPVRLGAPDDPMPIAPLLERLGIAHLAERHPCEVSLGEQQRVALARAAIVRPRLLVADEPVSHQNDAWAREMSALLADLAAGGAACLLATHNELAVEVADRVISIGDGRLHEVVGSAR